MLKYAYSRVKCTDFFVPFFRHISAFLVVLTTCEAAWCIILILSVCMSVCLSDYNFQKPLCRKFIFAHAAYLHALRVKFVYEGHRVKVKVTGAKKVVNSYSCSGNLRSAITPILSNMEPWCLRAAWVVEYCWSNGVTAIFITWPEVNTRN